MAQQPNILSPREPLSSKDGNVTRSWYRWFDSLSALAGKLLNPVVIAPNSIITPGDINSGSTVTLADSPAGTVLGNSQNVAAPPTPQVVDGSLTFTGGTLAAASLPPLTLSGNPTAVVATPEPVVLGDNLSFNGNTLNADVSSAGDLTWVASIRDTRGQVDTLERRAGELATQIGSMRDTRGQVSELARRIEDAFAVAMLALNNGCCAITLAADTLYGNSQAFAAAGSSIAIGANLALVSGTLSASGSIAASITVGANSLFGNPAGTAALGSNIAIGAGVSLSASGTLTGNWQAAAITTLGTSFTNSSGTLTFSTISGGALLGNVTSGLAAPGPVGIGAGLDTSAGNILAHYQAGTLTAFGTGVTLTSGTLTATGSGGTVTQIVAGANLTGGTITGSGTLALQASPTFTATAGTLPVIITGNSIVPTATIGGTMMQIVGAPATNVRILVDAFGANPAFTGRRANGTAALPTAIASSNILASFSAEGYGATKYGANQTYFQALASEAWSDTAQGFGLAFSTVANTTTILSQRGTLTNDGILVWGTAASSGTSKLQVVGTALLDLIKVGTDTGPQIIQGSGAPTIVAPSGSMFLRNDGSVGARTYINQNGTSSWAAIAGV